MTISTNNPIYTAAPAVNEICAPLKNHLEIIHFGYNKLFHDGGEIDLGVRPELIQNYRDQELYRYGAYWCQPGSYQTGFVLWSQLTTHQKIISTRERFQIGDGITFINKLNDGVEFFHFATTPQNKRMILFYLNNLDLLENFTRYFKDKASQLITEAEENKFYIPGEFSSDQSSNVLKDEILRNHFLKDISLESVENKLSQRQKECLYFLVKGMTYKEISKQMNLSPKTVEHYLEYTKNKLNCHNRTELIKMALNFRYIQDQLFL